MKLKLDENLGTQIRGLFEDGGHEASTVAGQRICGASDLELITRCRQERRALVTLDLDFANPLQFRPSEYYGIAVLRPSEPISVRHLKELCRTLLDALSRQSLQGQLWIVERGRIRIYQEPDQ